MKVVDIREAGSIELAAAAIHEAPIVVQLPTVFVLLAAPTTTGARQLDRTKARLAGKNYGTATARSIASWRRPAATSCRASSPMPRRSMP